MSFASLLVRLPKTPTDASYLAFRGKQYGLLRDTWFEARYSIQLSYGRVEKRGTPL